MKSSSAWIVALLLAGCAHGHTQGEQHGHAHPKQSRAGHAHEGDAHKGHAHRGHAHKHHTRHHRFRDPERWARIFDRESRAKWQKPAAVVKKLGLRATDHVADIGAGTGYFSLPLARAVPEGKVYALDIEKKMAAYAEARAHKEGLKQVQGGVAGADDPHIPAPVDVVFLCNTYHHIEGRTAYFQRVAKSLKSGGRVVIVDFKPGKLPVGPPPDHRVLPEAVDKELSAAGYKRLELDSATLPYQYIAIYGR